MWWNFQNSTTFFAETLCRMAEIYFMPGIVKLEWMFEEGIAKSLNIIRRVSFCLGTGLAFFAVSGGATYMEMGAIRSAQAITASGDIGNSVHFDLPRGNRRRLVEPVSDIAERENKRKWNVYFSK